MNGQSADLTIHKQTIQRHKADWLTWQSTTLFVYKLLHYGRGLPSSFARSVAWHHYTSIAVLSRSPPIVRYGTIPYCLVNTALVFKVGFDQNKSFNVSISFMQIPHILSSLLTFRVTKSTTKIKIAWGVILAWRFSSLTNRNRRVSPVLLHGMQVSSKLIPYVSSVWTSEDVLWLSCMAFTCTPCYKICNWVERWFLQCCSFFLGNEGLFN